MLGHALAKTRGRGTRADENCLIVIVPIPFTLRRRIDVAPLTTPPRQPRSNAVRLPGLEGEDVPE